MLEWPEAVMMYGVMDCWDATVSHGKAWDSWDWDWVVIYETWESWDWDCWDWAVVHETRERWNWDWVCVCRD